MGAPLAALPQALKCRGMAASMLLCHSCHCLPWKLSPFPRLDPPSLPKASCSRWLGPQERACSVQRVLGLGHPTEGQVLVSVLGRHPPAPEYPRLSAERSASPASFEEPRGFVCVRVCACE